MELFGLPVSTTVMLGIVVLGNLLPLLVITGIYLYSTRSTGSAAPAPFRPVWMARRLRRAA